MRCPPDAAIVDLVLPDGDGVEVTRRLREWSEMPILVLSAVGEEEQKVRALEAGADDYITKPFGARELVARLQAALRRAAPAEEEPVIVVEGLAVDLAGRVVVRDGEPVHLTPIEFELLRVLVRNRGRKDMFEYLRCPHARGDAVVDKVHSIPAFLGHQHDVCG